MGCTPGTLRKWVRQAEIDTGKSARVSTEEQQRIKALERELSELCRANEILRSATAFFAKAEFDRRGK